MEKYREYVSYLAKNKIDKTFINSDSDHALEVFVNLFNTSDRVVRIFAGCLCSPVSNKPEYIKAISDFIEKGGEVKILLNKFEKNAAINSNIIKRLAFYQLEGKKVFVKTTNAKPHYTNDPLKKELHFTIGDEKSYRIETDIEERTADCNFNNPPMAKGLIIFFDQVFNDTNSQDLILVDLFGLK